MVVATRGRHSSSTNVALVAIRPLPRLGGWPAHQAVATIASLRSRPKQPDSAVVTRRQCSRRWASRFQHVGRGLRAWRVPGRLLLRKLLLGVLRFDRLSNLAEHSTQLFYPVRMLLLRAPDCGAIFGQRKVRVHGKAPRLSPAWPRDEMHAYAPSTRHRYRIWLRRGLTGSNPTCCHGARLHGRDSNNTRSKISFRTSASRRVAKARLNWSHSLASRTSMYLFRSSSRRKGSGPPLRRIAFKKIGNPYTEDIGKLLQAASAETICAALVFLDLLKTDTERLGELALAHAQERSGAPALQLRHSRRQDWASSSNLSIWTETRHAMANTRIAL